MDVALESSELITILSQLSPEDQLLSQQAQMPQVVYKEFGSTARCGFLPLFVITTPPNKYTRIAQKRRDTKASEVRKKQTRLPNTAGSEWWTHNSKALGCCSQWQPKNQYPLLSLYTCIPYRVHEGLNSCKISVQVMAVKEYQANICENCLLFDY